MPVPATAQWSWSALWSAPNVLISPHMSGQVVGWRDELVGLFVDNLTRYIEGRPLRNVVTKPTPSDG